VFLNAFIPKDGTSVLDNAPVASQELFPILAEQPGDNTVLLPFEIFRDAFIGDADLPRAQEVLGSMDLDAHRRFWRRVTTPTAVADTVHVFDAPADDMMSSRHRRFAGLTEPTRQARSEKLESGRRAPHR
jgi:hypothetical protein